MNLSVPEVKLPVTVFLLFFVLAVPALPARGNAESSERTEQAAGVEVLPDTESPPEAGNPPDETGGGDTLFGGKTPLSPDALPPGGAPPPAEFPEAALPPAAEDSPPPESAETEQEIDEDSISVILDSDGFLRLITAGMQEDTSI
ncbi:MAG: hypothetical protein LBR47_03670, partial [Spirochaetaceae bacterium]|nr:hypothetical protein [Spirochaetaceae bacterium]